MADPKDTNVDLEKLVQAHMKPKKFDGEARRISVVIRSLQNIMEQYGDIDVYLYNWGDEGSEPEFPAETVKNSFY